MNYFLVLSLKSDYFFYFIFSDLKLRILTLNQNSFLLILLQNNNLNPLLYDTYEALGNRILDFLGGLLYQLHLRSH